LWIELQRLVLYFAGKSPGCGRGFFCAFYGRFLKGGLENVRFFGGVFVVKMWWIRGESR
jgi:hypothetical protein